jgi:hypothetical protein
MGRSAGDWRLDEVTNEVRSRDRNEWIETSARAADAQPSIEEYECECSFAPCTSMVGLTREEYEGVRAEATHFAIAINHENPEVDRVVFENERYAVVEKFLEMPRRVALETDPRR